MLGDARQIPVDSVVETDICIVGGGPAGLTLARELTGKAFRVLLLESGGMEPDEAAQSLNVGETTGDDFKPLETSRRRQLGGTANMWDTMLDDDQLGFRGAPLDPIDFERRSWLAHSGWPFGREALEPFYERAHRVGGFGTYSYDAERWQTDGAKPLPLDQEMVRTSIWHFGRKQTMTSELPTTVARAANVTVLLNATVVEIEANETATAVTGLRVACTDGPRFRVRAGIVVLAMGGIENARLLLLSRGVRAHGLGNQHDLVGRFFMEHQQVDCGDLIPFRRDVFDRVHFYDEHIVDGSLIMGQLQLSEAVMRRERLLNMGVALVPRPRGYRRIREDAIHSFEALASSVLHLRLPEDGRRHIRTVLAGADYVAAAACRRMTRGALFRHLVPGPTFVGARGWSQEPGCARRYGVFEVLLHTEQSPEQENRITLSDQRDRLGSRKARLHWRWGEQAIDSIRRAQRILAMELEKAGVGRLKLRSAQGRPCLIHAGLHHHTGTTRMHTDPRQGVVNEHMRVHGIANLFIAGCSVFPTSGFINPTLTSMALAIRLADYLKGEVSVSTRVQVTSGERSA